MNEKTNIGQSATGGPGNQTSVHCCGGGGSGGQGIAGGYFWSAGGTGCAAGKFGDSDFREQQLRKEKAEIYAALQQSELEATKWRCATEELRKSYAFETEELAHCERRLQFATTRADNNFKHAQEARGELEETKRKLAGVEKDRDVFRDEILNNMPALEKAAQLRAELKDTKQKLADAERKLAVSRVEFDSERQAELVYCLQTQNRQLKEHLEANSKGYHEARAGLEETKKKLADAEEACRIYRNRELNNSGVAPGSLAKLEQKAACLNRIKDLISGVYGKT